MCCLRLSEANPGAGISREVLLAAGSRHRLPLCLLCPGRLLDRAWVARLSSRDMCSKSCGSGGGGGRRTPPRRATIRDNQPRSWAGIFSASGRHRGIASTCAHGRNQAPWPSCDILYTRSAHYELTGQRTNDHIGHQKKS